MVLVSYYCLARQATFFISKFIFYDLISFNPILNIIFCKFYLLRFVFIQTVRNLFSVFHCFCCGIFYLLSFLSSYSYLYILISLYSTVSVFLSLCITFLHIEQSKFTYLLEIKLPIGWRLWYAINRSRYLEYFRNQCYVVIKNIEALSLQKGMKFHVI